MKEFICRKHLIEPFKVMLGIVLYVIGLFFVFSSISFLSASKSERNDIIFSYGLALIIIIIVLILGFVISYYLNIKKYKSISITLGKNNIIYKSVKGTSIIPYEDIYELDFPAIKYSKGWIKIVCKNETIKVDFAIENISIFIKELKEKLDELGLSKLYNEKRMNNYYVSASYSDASWDRIYGLSNLIPPSAALNVIFAFIFSFLVYEKPIKLIVAGILFLFPIVVICVSELILAIQHIIKCRKEEFITLRRNLEYENKIYKITLLFCSIIITAILVYFLLKF